MDVSEDGFTTEGVKLSMFNVTDPSNVTEENKYTIEESYGTEDVYKRQVLSSRYASDSLGTFFLS